MFRNRTTSAELTANIDAFDRLMKSSAEREAVKNVERMSEYMVDAKHDSGLHMARVLTDRPGQAGGCDYMDAAELRALADALDHRQAQHQKASGYVERPSRFESNHGFH